MTETLKDQLPHGTLVPVRFDEAESEDYGRVPIRRDWHEDAFHEMLSKIGCDGYGHVDDDVEGGDHEFMEGLEVPFADDDPKRHYVIDTPLFTLRPFYWGDDDDVYALPNFVYKPWDYQIEWYKYPMRDAYGNFHISDDDWSLMLDTVTKACLRRPKAETEWLMDVDDFPRMSESDAIAWEMRKRLSKAWSRVRRLENLAFRIAYEVPIESDAVRAEIKSCIGIEDEDFVATNERD